MAQNIKFLRSTSTTTPASLNYGVPAISIVGGITRFYVGNDSNNPVLVGSSAITSPSFSSITGGTNTSAAMVVGSGASLSATGTGTIAATSVTGLSIASGKTLTASNSLTLAGTDSTTMTFPGSSDTVMGLGAIQTISAAKTFNDGTFKLAGASSGTLTIKAAATAGTNTLTLPAGTTDFSSTGGTSQVVKQTSAGGAFTVAQLVQADISGLTTASSPTFTGLNLSGLTASYAVVTNGSKNLASLQYTSANTASTLVSRDGSGNFSAGTITAALSGNASTASAWNTGIAAVPAVDAYDASGTTLATNTNTKINLTGTNLNIGGFFDTTNKRFLPTKAGIYRVNGQIYITNASLLTRYSAIIYVNGSALKQGDTIDASSTGALSFGVECLVSLNGSTDYVELYGFNSNASNTASTQSGGSATYMTINYVGPSS